MRWTERACLALRRCSGLPVIGTRARLHSSKAETRSGTTRWPWADTSQAGRRAATLGEIREFGGYCGSWGLARRPSAAMTTFYNALHEHLRVMTRSSKSFAMARSLRRGPRPRRAGLMTILHSHLRSVAKRLGHGARPRRAQRRACMGSTIDGWHNLALASRLLRSGPGWLLT